MKTTKMPLKGDKITGNLYKLKPVPLARKGVCLKTKKMFEKTNKTTGDE